MNKLARPGVTLTAMACALSTVVLYPQPRAQPELKVTRIVTGNVLTSAASPAVQIRVDQSLRYVGAQRFILRDVADAEQHVFAEVDEARTVRRMYWIQFEQYLPGRGGEYDYDSDAAATRWGLPLRTHVRRFVEPPAAGSDRERVHQLLERNGLRVPLPSIRARLVYVPAADRRQELMVIYLEPAAASEPTPAESAQLLDRALAGLTITPSR